MNNHRKSFSSIEQALDAIKRGEFVVVLDNEDRENEGDLIMAAEFATESSLAFMVRYTSGLICVPALKKRLKELELPLMVANNSESRQCKFTISTDLIAGTTTGISAADRARTISAIADDRTSAKEFRRPGHIFPLLALDGGVLARAGHTEAAIDLTRLAGCKPVGYICEITNDDGTMMRKPELVRFAQLHNLHLITISDLIRYRCDREELVTIDTNQQQKRVVNTPFGSFDRFNFKSLIDSRTFEVLVHGHERLERENVMVHIAQNGVEGSVNVQWAQKKMQTAGCGIIVYASQMTMEFEEICGKDMADQIIFGMSTQILKKLGVQSVRLLSAEDINFQLKSFALPVTEVMNVL